MTSNLKAIDRQYAVIGIDFGTTFSGVSWTWSGNLATTEQIHAWNASGRDRNSDKVPTKLIYNDAGHVKGWGFDEPDEHGFGHTVEWFKLLLSDKAAGLDGEKIKQAKAALVRLGKDAVEAAADYLKKLWDHTLSQLELKLTKIALDNMDIRVVLTKPANWDHKAEQRTRTAAELAGIATNRPNSTTTLRLVSEPEAAALAAWKEAGFRLRPDIEDGDSFTVCDAGGGTVDLISYTVEAFDPFKLKMCVIPTAGLCGAIFLDQKFENVLRTEVGAERWDKLKDHAKTKALRDDWENGLKRKYDGSSAQNCYSIDLIGLKTARFMRTSKITNSITLDRGTINAVFDPICAQVVQLVRVQVDEVKEKSSRKPKAILLVGGFSENDFLLKRIRESCPGIPVQRPTNAWSAISRGAVVKGQTESQEEDIVTNVITKYSYGLMCSTKYNPFRHKLEDRYIDRVTGEVSATNQIVWFLERGKNLSKQEPVIRQFVQKFDKKWDNPEMHDYVVISEARIPPTRFEKGVEHCCTLKSHISPWVYNGLETNRSPINGKEYKTLEVVVEMRVTSEDLEWTVQHENVSRGSTVLQVEYEQPRHLMLTAS